jgi:hypothetical protein
MKLRKNPKFIPSWENALLMGWKDPQEELNLDSKLISSTHPKFAHG